MALIQAFIHHPVKVSVGVLLLVLFGLIALTQMPMQLTPEVEIPTISIETRWPGASPQEVEREIIQEQEEQLKSVEGVTRMSSDSADSMGTITLEFVVGTNMEEALLKVNSRLQQVPEYPEEADEPVISTSGTNDRYIAWFILSNRVPEPEEIRDFQRENPELAAELEPVLAAHSRGLAELRLRRAAEKHAEIRQALFPNEVDVPKLRRFAEDVIEARFERVPGVSNSNVFGGREEELQVVVDPEKLAARQLTIDDVRQALRAQNQDTSGGDLWEGKRRWVIRTLGQFQSPEQVERQILAIHDGSPVYVRDVALVREDYKKPDGFVRRFGSSTIAVNVVRETGANVLDVMDQLRLANTELNQNVLQKRGLMLTQVYDETEYIYSAINLVNQNIILGGALTVIVLMLFLHAGPRTLIFVPLIAVTALAAMLVSEWIFAITVVLIIVGGFWFARGALVVSLAIPISIVGTFLMLNLFGRSLNVISLAGLAFAVGMLVDNAVVVLENVYRHYQLGQRSFMAAALGAKEVWGAVVASTLTTLAVFLPILLIQEEAGQLFRDIALAISCAVGLSLLVSITVIPPAAARLLTDRPSRRREAEAAETDRSVDRIAVGLHSFGGHVIDWIVGMNRWIQRTTVRRLGVVAGLVVTSLVLLFVLFPDREYLPNGNRNLVFAFILPPPGYNLNQLEELGQTVEDGLQPYWDVEPDSAEAQALPFPVIEDFFYVARGRSVFLGLRAADPTRVAELIPLVQSLRDQLPGSFLVAQQAGLFGRGLAAGRAIDVEITGPELSQLTTVGGMILGGMTPILEPEKAAAGLPTETQTRPIPSLDLSSPEIHVKPKLVQAAEMGVNPSSLGYTVDALVDGAYATDYYIGGDKIDLVILGSEQFVERTQDVEQLPVATPTGQVVPISALASVELSSGPEQIAHRERQRAITIQVTPPPAMPLEDAIRRIEESLPKTREQLRQMGITDDDYTITLSGTADKLRATDTALFANLGFAAIITYLLMAALFESWIHPLVVIFSVFWGAVGGIIGLQALNGYLMLTGQTVQLLDVITMLGFFILIGTVVNNAILIVHQALNHMREDGHGPREAVLESVRTRIRPIFMTTGTTLFGLAPLVLFPGAGSELYRGLGSVVLGGLFLSTVFTLVMIPAMFTLMLDLQELTRGLFRRQQRAPRAVPQDEDVPEVIAGD